MTININKTTQTIGVSDNSKLLILDAPRGVKLPANSFKSIELEPNNIGSMDISPVAPVTLDSPKGAITLDFNKRLHYVDTKYNAIMLNDDVDYLKQHISSGIEFRNNRADSRINALESASLMPLGTIIMWSGNSLPLGYIFCDGGKSNGITSPDLRNRFLVAGRHLRYGQWLGYDPAIKNNYRMRDTGGEATHKLTVDELPQHKHIVPWGDHLIEGVPWGVITRGGFKGTLFGSAGRSDDDNLWRYSSPPFAADAGRWDEQISNLGTSHNNMPDYYTLAFIMYVGT